MKEDGGAMDCGKGNPENEFQQCEGAIHRLQRYRKQERCPCSAGEYDKTDQAWHARQQRPTGDMGRDHRGIGAHEKIATNSKSAAEAITLTPP
ncbi:MAG: hypothetical protein ACREHV_06055 [Rhizomicrobium sp.]